MTGWDMAAAVSGFKKIRHGAGIVDSSHTSTSGSE